MEKIYLSVVCKSESEVENVLNSNVINKKIFKYEDNYQYWVDKCLPSSLSELEEGDCGYEYKSKWNDIWGGDGDIDEWRRCIFEKDNCAIIIFKIDIDKGYIYDWIWETNFIVGKELDNYKQQNNGYYEKYKNMFINLINYDEFIKFRKDTTNIKKITEQQILNCNIIDFMDIIYPSNKNVDDDIERKTQEYKELLIKDLCGRLPYGVKVLCLRDFNREWYNLEMIDIGDDEVYLTAYEPYTNRFEKIRDIKPYLFPISSMTEEQLYELREMFGFEIEFGDGFIELSTFYNGRLGYLEMDTLFEWFDRNHFDYRGLIPLGLANNAVGLNIY